MKKIKEYKSVMNDKVGIRINGNESCKNIEKNELDEIIKEIKKILKIMLLLWKEQNLFVISLRQALKR